jgi:hypothetical protein
MQAQAQPAPDAQAIVADVPLVTADRTILEHLPLATWD